MLTATVVKIPCGVAPGGGHQERAPGGASMELFGGVTATGGVLFWGWGCEEGRTGQGERKIGLHCHILPLCRATQQTMWQIAGADLRRPTVNLTPLPRGRRQMSPSSPPPPPKDAPTATMAFTECSSSCLGYGILWDLMGCSWLTVQSNACWLRSLSHCIQLGLVPRKSILDYSLRLAILPLQGRN